MAVRGSGGAARPARALTAVAVLAIPLAIPYGLWVEIGPPDHMGTSAFVLVSFLLIDRDRVPRYTAPLVGAILCADQLSDITVRYVAVPAIVLVSVYRMAATRRIFTSDAAIALAAAGSVPAELLVHAALRHFGGYLMEIPSTKTAPPGEWGHNAGLAWGGAAVAVRCQPGAGYPAARCAEHRRTDRTVRCGGRAARGGRAVACRQAC